MLITSAQFIAGIVDLRQLPKQRLLEVVFTGRSNVGKSSLINVLCGRKHLARTSNTPGKTQQLNYYLINKKFYFVDLPGYGYAKAAPELRRRWKHLIEGYLSTSSHIKLAVQLIDARLEITESDKTMIDYLNQFNIPHIVVLTKADKTSRSQLARHFRLVKQLLGAKPFLDAIIPFSAVTGEGKKEVLQAIKQHL
jgi:GTP-binding protein